VRARRDHRSAPNRWRRRLFGRSEGRAWVTEVSVLGPGVEPAEPLAKVRKVADFTVVDK